MGKTDLNGMDTRVIEFHRRNRNVTDDEIAAHNNSMPDEAAEGEDSETTFSSSYNDRHYGDTEGADAEA